jgi:putative hydrolase of the HAD superfamily
MLKNLKHIFFDLDKTLWDFETNSTLTLIELFEKHDLASYGIPSFVEMMDIYKKINQKLWVEYSKNLITKETLRTERFKQTFEYFGVYNYDLAFRFGLDYVELSPRKNKLYPYTIETLNYLFKKYDLHIITNGFEEVQYIKLQSSGIINYFKNIITSEKAGAKKPDKAIFEYALNVCNASTNNSIMIGDDLEVDIMGALNANIPAIHFLTPSNNQKSSDKVITINCLSKLIEIL